MLHALSKRFVCVSAFVLMFILSACNSSTEGLTAPQLKIESLTIATINDEPSFVITYILKHNSSKALPIAQVTADVFIDEHKVANLTKNFEEGYTINPNVANRFQLVVPANLAGTATRDSLKHNSLLTLEGSCAMYVQVSTDPKQSYLNTSASYHDFIKTFKQ